MRETGPPSAATGRAVYPGWPVSSEALLSTQKGSPLIGWHAYWGTTEPTRAAFWRDWVFERSDWNWWTSTSIATWRSPRS